MIIKRIAIKTNSRKQMVNITQKIESIVKDSGIDNGIITVFCPHTTAGITINECADPDVVKDLLHSFDILSPDRPEFKHYEGNSDAHLLSTLTGTDCRIIIHNNELLLGRWQGVYFCEFDGARNREIILAITEG